MQISVVIPLYNKAPYLVKALGSVLAQTYVNYEIIIVDDGSTDGSADIARDFLTRNSLANNWKIISQENSGVSTARNNGVAVSVGDYICFLDADDWWAPIFLEEISGLIAKYPNEGLYCSNYYYVKNNHNRVLFELETGYMDYCKVFANVKAMPVWTGAVCIPKYIFDKTDGFNPNLRLGEDFDLWIRIAMEYKMVFLNKPLAYYNQDVDLTYRATRRLHKPEHHMLFNLAYLEPYEKTNAEYKRLIDWLRVTGLMDYYLSRKYHQQALIELRKVDWNCQPFCMRMRYICPISLQKLSRYFISIASKIKQYLIRMGE